MEDAMHLLKMSAIATGDANPRKNQENIQNSILDNPTVLLLFTMDCPYCSLLHA